MEEQGAAITDSTEIERDISEEVTASGRDNAAHVPVPDEQWSLEKLIDWLEATGSEDFAVAIAKRSTAMIS